VLTNTKISRYIYFASTLLFLISLISCGSSGGIRSGKTLNQADIPLEKKYRKIIIQKFIIDPQLEKDYPEAVNACESTTMKELLKNSSIPQIVKVRTSNSREADTLIIRTKITSLRIVSSDAGNKSGVSAGSSEMTVNLKLIDAESGHAVREKNLSTANKADDASSDGSSIRFLPYDLGKAVAEYIVTVVKSP
jgi:hypothetical protein